MCDNGTLIPCKDSSLAHELWCDACAEGTFSVIELSRRAILRRMIDTGSYDPACTTCTKYVGAAENPLNVMYPNHDGSRYCQSGSLASGGHRSHCTCDTCF
jgi:hypothetical protein